MLNLFFYGLLTTFSFGQLGRMSFFGQQVNVYLYEIFLLLIISFLFFRFRFKPIISVWKKIPLACYFFIYLFFSFFLKFNHFNLLQNLISFLYFSRLFLYFLFFVYLSFLIKKESKFRKTIYRSLNIFIILTFLVGLVQYFLYPDLRNLVYAGWDPHLYRVFGVFFDTSVAGAIYGMIFFYLLFRYFRKMKKSRLILILFLPLIFILLTYSRTLYITFFLSITYFLTRKKMYKQIFLIVFIFLLSIFLLPRPFGEGVNLKRVFSVQSRVKDYQDGISIWEESPVFGIGYNRIRYAKKRKGMINIFDYVVTHAGASFHSSFLIILTTGGILGIAFFLLMLFGASRWGLFQEILILFLSIFSLADNILLHSFILFLLLIFFSLSNPLSDS